MVRRRFGALFVAGMLCLHALGQPPEASLEGGVSAFRAGDFAAAVDELTTVADAAASAPTQEAALVYLALAQFRLAREHESRATIERLLALERTSPTYATLPLGGVAGELETLVAALVPGAVLPRNTMAADAPMPVEVGGEAALPLPPVKPVQQPPMESDAHAAEVEAEAAARVVAAEADARRRIAEEEQRAQQELEARVAAERAASSAATARSTTPAVVTATSDDGEIVRAALNDLRQAEALANHGDVEDARRMYARLTSSPAREVLAAAAVGLYRVGSYREAISAFRRLGALARGEEDLHFYYAVSLYEAGDPAAAMKELRCALPFIEVTEEVARYRVKIERSQS